jgi:hypothetical protein
MARCIISSTATARHLHQLDWAYDRSMPGTFATNVTGRIISTTTGKLQQRIRQNDRSMAGTFATDVTGRIISTTTGKGWRHQQRNSKHPCKQLDFHEISPR